MAKYPQLYYGGAGSDAGMQYQAPGQQELALLQQYISSIGSGGGQAGLAGMQGAMNQPGAFDALRSAIPAAMKFMQGGADVGGLYNTAGQAALQNQAKAGLNTLRSEAGAKGNLGSTVMGMDLADLGNQVAAQSANIRATGAQLGEQSLQGRAGLAMQGLGMYGGMAGDQRAQSIGGYGQMAGLGMQQQGMNQAQLLQSLAALQGQRLDPFNAGLNIYGVTNSVPRSPSGLDNIFAGLGAASTFF